MVKVHINNTEHITNANIYRPPRDSTSTHYQTADMDIHHCIQHIKNQLSNSSMGRLLPTYSNIHKPWKERRDHRHYTHIILKTIHGLSNRAHPPTLNTSITFNNNHTQTYYELFHIKIISNYIKGRKTNTTYRNHNVNSKLALHKVASFHQHYLTFTLQTYHHPEH